MPPGAFSMQLIDRKLPRLGYTVKGHCPLLPPEIQSNNWTCKTQRPGWLLVLRAT